MTVFQAFMLAYVFLMSIVIFITVMWIRYKLQELYVLLLRVEFHTRPSQVAKEKSRA